MSATVLQRFTRHWWPKSAARPEGERNAFALAPDQEKVVRLAQKCPPLYRFSPAVARKLYHGLELPFGLDNVAMAQVREYRIDTQGRAEARGPIRLRAYYPQVADTVDDHARPALVYYHGGGMVIGSIDTHDTLCRYLAKQTGLVVISVDYRRAPEAKFPLPVEDAIVAWNWVCDNAVDLAIDIDRVGVGGDSAGGYLATSVCLQSLQSALTHAPRRKPTYQWLLYPMLDLRCDSDSYRRCVDNMLLTSDFMFYFRDHYLNGSEEANNPVASPLLTRVLEGMPPSYVLTVYHDPLLDEGRAYVKSLQDQGCDVTHHHHDDCMHGFVTFAGVCTSAREALKKAAIGLSALTQDAG